MGHLPFEPLNTGRQSSSRREAVTHLRRHPIPPTRPLCMELTTKGVDTHLAIVGTRLVGTYLQVIYTHLIGIHFMDLPSNYPYTTRFTAAAHPPIAGNQASVGYHPCWGRHQCLPLPLNIVSVDDVSDPWKGPGKVRLTFPPRGWRCPRGVHKRQYNYLAGRRSIVVAT